MVRWGWIFALSCLFGSAVQAEVTVRDDSGAEVRLSQPARRIVSLAPHATENLYAAGAGARLVGAVDYSDFPEAALALPRVGGYSRPDLEAVLALKPDLVVAWVSGNPPVVVEKLRALGVPVYLTQPDRLEDIANGIEKLGRLAGSEPEAEKAAARFRQRLAALRGRHAARPAVPLFYQVWHQPLLTVGGGQIISEVIRLCGGENVFAALPGKAPAVSVEAILAANPEAIVASGMGRDAPVGLERWKPWSRMKAVARGNLFFVPSDLLQRPTPRLLDGAEQLCGQLETVRGRRP
ncbi:MAG: cobalamin-binding protein [Betaproteobacteria bacterium]|nr:cobalamin-binding protein [Betaproteobacteria bacterium]